MLSSCPGVCMSTAHWFQHLDHFVAYSGNHESQVMNQMYGFEGEVKAKYTAQMAELFTEIYNHLPLCHLINKKILVNIISLLFGSPTEGFLRGHILYTYVQPVKVMHGGIFKQDGVKIDDLRRIDRNRQPPEEGLMCDLLWSDPQEARGRAPSKRGVGVQFGPDVTSRFCAENGLDYIVRCAILPSWQIAI